MSRALAALTVLALLGAAPVAAGKTSHKGWPKINGLFRIDRHDRGKTYHGSAKSDELLGGHGNNRLYGGPAADVLWGDYKPCCWPAHQSDRIFGGDGNDFIYASHSFNHIEGGRGDDKIHAKFGFGSIDCGEGNDIAFVSHSSKRRYKFSGCETVTFRRE
jgi:Ca2+-binding RTX toxin-like protein